jgi:thiamine biosynthesis protein ThiS
VDIKINGEIQSVPDGVRTILDLFDYLALKPQGRVVEFNGSLCLPDRFSEIMLLPGSVVEIIQFMGGG